MEIRDTASYVDVDAAKFRAATPAETAHYQQFGWVKLEKYIPQVVVRDILALGKDKMGENGDRNAPPETFSYFNPLTMHGLNHPVLGPVIRQCGQDGRLFMARRAEVGVRYFTDFFNVKLPTKTEGDHGGKGASDSHQDYAASGSDRSGALVFWIALEDLPPEKGTMAFLNGSHRYGVLGHYATYGEGNLLQPYPELLDHCSPTELLSYSAGDVTVHSNLVVHSAGTNVTDGPRWTYTVIVNPADSCWNGGAIDACDTEGLELHKEFDDERFPIIG